MGGVRYRENGTTAAAHALSLSVSHQSEMKSVNKCWVRRGSAPGKRYPSRYKLCTREKFDVLTASSSILGIESSERDVKSVQRSTTCQNPPGSVGGQFHRPGHAPAYATSSSISHLCSRPLNYLCLRARRFLPEVGLERFKALARNDSTKEGRGKTCLIVFFPPFASSRTNRS